jgi:hypothetical protein
MAAAYHGCLPVLTLLLEQRADTELADKFGRTALVRPAHDIAAAGFPVVYTYVVFAQ